MSDTGLHIMSHFTAVNWRIRCLFR